MTKERSASNIDYGSYLIIPLKYDGKISSLKKHMEKSGLKENTVTSTDLNDIFRSMLNGKMGNPVGINFALPEGMISGAGDDCVWLCANHEYKFLESYLYIFHTKVTFLCIGISYDSMESLNHLCKPGGNEPEEVSLTPKVKDGRTAEFELNARIKEVCEKLKLELFFDNSYALLDRYTYIIALSDEWCLTTDELKKKTFKMHQMVSPDSEVEDTSEDDIKYVYSVKNEVKNAYRWGCCIASQIFAHLWARSDSGCYSSIPTALKEEGQNTLPIIVFSLYERYTCLRFIQELNRHLGNKNELNELKKLMLAFKAYGTFPAVDLSRYYNIKQIYRHLSDINDINEAINDVEFKLKLLMDNQQEEAQSRNDWLFYFITVFGAISIIEAAQSIVQNWESGDPIVLGITVISALLIFAVIAISRLKK